MHVGHNAWIPPPRKPSAAKWAKNIVHSFLVLFYGWRPSASSSQLFPDPPNCLNEPRLSSWPLTLGSRGKWCVTKRLRECNSFEIESNILYISWRCDPCLTFCWLRKVERVSGSVSCTSHTIGGDMKAIRFLSQRIFWYFQLYPETWTMYHFIFSHC